MWQAISLTLFPSLVWLLVALRLRTNKLSIGRIFVGLLAGVAASLATLEVVLLLAPILTSPDRWIGDFLDSVVSAALVEETLKYVCVTAICFVFVKANKPKGDTIFQRDIIAIAVSVAIGFMSLENIIAVIGTDEPLLRARDRLASLFAGHPSFQVMMGFWIAKAIQLRHRWAWPIALGVPVFVHGLIDFSQQAFKDEPNHGSLEDSILFYLWFGSLVSTAVVTGYLLERFARRKRDARSLFYFLA